jgi:Flp pilus assembly protein TadG
MRRQGNQRGAALVEAAMMIPLLLFIAVAIFEFGRAYQTWQVLTNAAREGARYGITPGSTTANATTIAQNYMRDGALDNWGSATIGINQGVPMEIGSGTQVTIDYPFEFIVFQPIAQLVVSGSMTGAPITMHATALMRNEAP